MKRKLFGTDGIRGVAGEDISPSLAYKTGMAAVSVLKGNRGTSPHVILATDTRISKDSLSLALCAGVCSAGGRVTHLGVLPTPAVSYLTERMGADAGIMISASHNPYRYNGIKIFSSSGIKLSDELEEETERIILTGGCDSLSFDGVFSACDMTDEYVSHLLASNDSSIKKMRIGVDCANGAAYRSAKKLFSRLPTEAVFIGDTPSGRNINEGCGSTSLTSLSSLVKKNSLDLGVAFDGDADRLLAVDENGDEVDGDVILAVCAEYMLQKKRLRGGIVGTVMSNLGLSKYCEERNIGYIGSAVGDRHVLEEMNTSGYNLGGEQSGHIIFSDYAKAGDGQLSAIKLLEAVSFFNIPLSSLSKLIKKYPQITINVPATERDKKMLTESDAVLSAHKKARELLGGNGRIILRASGTEPLIRIMGEHSDRAVLSDVIDSLMRVIEREKEK